MLAVAQFRLSVTVFSVQRPGFYPRDFWRRRERLLSEYADFPSPSIISPIIPTHSSVTHRMDNGPIRGCSSRRIVSPLNYENCRMGTYGRIHSSVSLTEPVTQPTLNTNCMEQKNSWELKNLEFPCISWNLNVRYRSQNSPPLTPIKSQTHPVHTLSSNFLNIRFNIILL
jgi:hypothetical protein